MGGVGQFGGCENEEASEGKGFLFPLGSFMNRL